MKNLKQNQKETRESYVSPEIEVLSISVESGFAASTIVPGMPGGDGGLEENDLGEL